MYWNCLLCGTRNSKTVQLCASCGIPRGQGDYRRLPEGWEVCLIARKTLEIIDAEDEIACYEARLYSAHGKYVGTYRSAPFQGEQWLDENYAAPRPTDEQTRLYEDIRARVLADGWHQIYSYDGKPLNQFWRRTSSCAAPCASQ